MRTIGVITTSRADYGAYLPVLRAIDADPALDLRLLVSGMHLSPEFGLTIQVIEEDGLKIETRVETILSSDTPQGVSKAIGLGITSFAQVFNRFRPDVLVVLGDRYEMYAAAVAALPFRIPVAHIHGGEVTQGAIDDALRHSMTKLSHLHFVATEAYQQRVIQLGEEPWRVTVSGAPSLDNLSAVKLLTTQELTDQFGISINRPPLLVTFHPVTLEYEQTAWQIGELLAALETTGLPVVFTMPNADTGGREIAQRMRAYAKTHSSTQMVENLGTQGYFSLMAQAAAMVGNSASGIIEAASFALPVVNIGTRQQGRVRGANVIDAGYSRGDILVAIEKVLTPAFKQRLAGTDNPYGTGQAAETIVRCLKEIKLDDRLIVKRFYDLTDHTWGTSGA